MKFYSGTELIGTDTKAPYQAEYNFPEGVYNFTAVAYDNEGLMTTSSKVKITVYDSRNALREATK